jgi:hypothetical protein
VLLLEGVHWGGTPGGVPPSPNTLVPGGWGSAEGGTKWGSRNQPGLRRESEREFGFGAREFQALGSSPGPSGSSHLALEGPRLATVHLPPPPPLAHELGGGGVTAGCGRRLRETSATVRELELLELERRAVLLEQGEGRGGDPTR